MKGFLNAKIYIEGKGVVRTNLGFNDGEIVYVGDCAEGIEPIGDFKNVVVVPGFIDQHTHGAAGGDGMDGSVDAISKISCALAKEGTVAYLVTTMTQSVENLKKAVNAVKTYRNTASREGAEVLGVHLEGPFISKDYIGAQPLEHVAYPNVEIYDLLNNESGNCIKMITMAPEVEGSEEFIKHVTKNGCVVSVGHSAAGFKDVLLASEWGASCVTHTYNAQKGVHHREIGVAGSAMLLDEYYCELICDTIHVSVPAIKLVIKNKPHDKVVLVTDAMRAKHLPDGVYDLGGQDVYVKDGEARLANGALAASLLKMNVAIKNLVDNGIPFTDAVDFATINPAKNLKIDRERGSIKVGKRADFTLLDEKFDVVATIRGGEIIYKRD